MLRGMVQEFAETEIAPRALHLDRKCEIHNDIAMKMASLGLLGDNMAAPSWASSP